MNATTTSATSQPNKPGAVRLRLTYLLLGLTVLWLLIAWLYAAWHRQQTHDANLPAPGLAAVTVALRTFHEQTGRFPHDFRELDERLWQHAKQSQISAEGRSLIAPAAHYYYTLHVVNPSPTAQTAPPPAVGLWAVPLGPRASEAATHFWYITPTTIERWQGPALTAENVGAVGTLPTEQQLALLVMTRQTGPAPTQHKPTGILDLWPF